MNVLRFLSLTTLSLWIGGLGILGGIAAPVMFATLQEQDPVGGRETAGVVFGVIFQHFQSVSWICGGALLALFGVRAALGPRPRRLAVRVWILVAMLGVSIATSVWLVPRIDRIRNSAPGIIASLPADDPRRIEFGRLHGLSNGLMLVTLAGGLLLLWLEARDTA
jgi:tellurite resistance protein TehA-like permease